MNGNYDSLQYWVRQLLQDLPARRDWLDPIIEKNLRDAVSAFEAVQMTPRREMPTDHWGS